MKWLPLAASVALGLIYAFVIPAGLPYDEPSHWSTARLLGGSHALPELGRAGVTYEAQQPPLAYLVLALASGAARALTSSESVAFHVGRIVNGAEWTVALALCGQIGQRVLRSGKGALPASLYIAVAPMFLAMGWSINNDALSLALGFAAVLLLCDGSGRRRSSVWAGVLAGLGVLTKLTVFPVLVGALVFFLVRRRPWRTAIVDTVAFFVPVAVLSGWWFVYNEVTYGRLLPPTDVGGGPVFPAYGLHGLSTLTHMAQNVVSYLWVPTEYYRNTIHLPAPAQSLIALVTVLIAVFGTIGLVRGRTRLMASERDARILVALVAVVAVVGWAVCFVFLSAVAPRFGYMALPGWVVLLASVPEGLRVVVRSGRAVIAMSYVPAALALTLAVWALARVASLPTFPFVLSL